MSSQNTNNTTPTSKLKQVGYLHLKAVPPIQQVSHLPEFEGFYTATWEGDLYYNCEKRGCVKVNPTKEGYYMIMNKGYTTMTHPVTLLLKYYWPNIYLPETEYWIKGYEGVFTYNFETKSVWRWFATFKREIRQDKNITNRVVLWLKGKQKNVNLEKANLVLDYR